MKAKTYSLVLFLLLVREVTAGESERTDPPIPEVKLQMDTRQREMPQLLDKNDSFYQQFTTNSRIKLEYRIRDIANPIGVRLNEMSDPTRPLMGMGKVTGAMKSSLREMVVATPLIEDSQDWLREFVQGMIGN